VFGSFSISCIFSDERGADPLHQPPNLEDQVIFGQAAMTTRNLEPDQWRKTGMALGFRKTATAVKKTRTDRLHTHTHTHIYISFIQTPN